jgi:hypothetical protein
MQANASARQAEATRAFKKGTDLLVADGMVGFLSLRFANDLPFHRRLPDFPLHHQCKGCGGFDGKDTPHPVKKS